MTLLLVLYLVVALLTILFLAYTDYLALGYNDLDLGILAAYLIAGLAWPIFLSVNVYYAIKYLLATRR